MAGSAWAMGFEPKGEFLARNGENVAGTFSGGDVELIGNDSPDRGWAEKVCASAGSVAFAAWEESF